MASNKKRRTINIHVELFDLLSNRARCIQTSPTKLAAKILSGEEKPVTDSYEPTGTKSISMPESLWYALKLRSQDAAGIKGSSPSAQLIGQKILNGLDTHLSEFHIKEGIRIASEKESQRGCVKSVAITSSINSCEITEAVSDEGSHDMSNSDISPRNSRPLSGGRPVDGDNPVKSDKVEPDQEYYGGVLLM